MRLAGARFTVGYLRDSSHSPDMGLKYMQLQAQLSGRGRRTL